MGRKSYRNTLINKKHKEIFPCVFYILNRSLAFLLVADITFSIDVLFISASLCAVKYINPECFILPLYGCGASYGASVSIRIFSSGIHSATSTVFLAFLNVNTPENEIYQSRFTSSFAISALPLKL